jgi:dihydroxy-acid dehydratase
VAIAFECGINFEQSDITDICKKTPYIADLKPAGTYSIHEFQKIGGVLLVMKLLLQHGFIHPDCKTITGKTIAENLSEIKVPASQNIIQFPENLNLYTPRPYTRKLSGLTGNFAPEGGLVYRSNSEILEFKGPLRCFDSEEAAIEAITKHIYVNGDVILIRYEGPVGGPGMREMYIPQLLLQAQGTLDNVALITDGRFSNLGSGFCVSHIGPEAALGGPIGLVKDGDMISITIKEDIISVNLSNEELEARRGLWKPREPLFLSAVASKYKKLVSSANKGAVTHERCNLN